VDAGLSRRETFRRMVAIGEDPEQIDAVLITHEHSDHVNGLIPLLRKWNKPVFVTRLTAPNIDWGGYAPKLEAFQAGTGFTIGDIEVNSFTVPHDAIDPVGYSIRAEGVKIAIVTDLGYMPESICHHLKGTNFLLLESNHDLDMLKVGPYPWSVKQRVMGRRGHLSNDVVSTFIRDHLDSAIHTLMLGHLSEHNNHPEIVRITAQQALDCRGIAAGLVVAESGKQSAVFEY
jgi:phosphoribosyl 1,2-cyclic phosphodiesterase